VVNGQLYRYFFAGGDTAATVAAALVQSVNGAGSPVTATASNGVLFLQSAVGGSATNYPVSIQLNAANEINPPPLPFTATISAPTMAGGADSSAFVYALDVGTDPSGTIFSANDSVNGNWQYFYDNQSRLQQAFTPSLGYQYDYDRYGNRLHQTPLNGGSGSSLVYVNNQISDPAIQYDASGNMISDGNHTYAYDAENRLISVDGGQTATYLYNADGLRVRSTVGTAFADYIHESGGATVGVLGVNGILIRQEFGGLATYTSNGAYFHHRDWLGNLRVITDQNGAIQQTCTNLPYGDALTCSAPGSTPTYFTGYLRDPETNLDFAEARYFSSQFGRFMSPDPHGGGIGDPQSLNLYAYVLNSPLSAVDPSGMDVNFIWLGSSNGGGVVISAFGGNAFGGFIGNFGACASLDCGFGGGGGGSSRAGKPTSSQLAAEHGILFNPEPLQPFPFLLGVGEELTVNSVVDFAVLIDRIRQKTYGGPDFNLERNRIAPSGYSENAGMFAGGILPFFIPGLEEEEAGASLLNYRRTFFRAFPELKGEVIVHHAVEQQALSRFPSLFTPQEIHALENLRGIPRGINGELHLSQIRAAWNEFYRTTPNPTRAQILQRAVDIDKKFGARFRPPIR
jgi:RHS repeat-associated protein